MWLNSATDTHVSYPIEPRAEMWTQLEPNIESEKEIWYTSVPIQLGTSDQFAHPQFKVYELDYTVFHECLGSMFYSVL